MWLFKLKFIKQKQNGKFSSSVVPVTFQVSYGRFLSLQKVLLDFVALQRRTQDSDFKTHVFFPFSMSKTLDTPPPPPPTHAGSIFGSQREDVRPAAGGFQKKQQP